MRVGLRQGVALWRRAGTAAAVRGTAEMARGAAREARLRARPLEIAPGEVAAALGGMDPVLVLRGRVLAAMPTVARFEDGLVAIDDLVARADAVAAHRFDLLGSGPTELGPKIDWRRDFKGGRSWPLHHGSLMRLAHGDGSDVKVPWELSRCQHLPLLAAAHRLTGERRYLDEVGAQLQSWIEQNPVELGPNWASTMDVAIRAANWVAALALCAEEAAREPWLVQAIESLLLHGRFVRSHLEWSEARGNHYLADIVGLLPIAALFSGGWEGRDWAVWATDELVSEMEHQVRPDGCAHEASTAYHRLVTELFLCGTQAADALVPGRLPDWYRQRLERMLGFVRDYTRPDGLAPQIGDADDGRFLPLAEYGADPRDHRHLFVQAGLPFEPATGTAAYPDGGYYVMRTGNLYAIVHCGDTGRHGSGGHGHNDQLSFELAVGGRPLVVDPGTYLYTADPVERNRFRSTAFHSTLRIGGAEQNELRDDDLFLMADRSRAEALACEGTAFEGRHHGFPDTAHTRRLELGEGGLRIRDTVSSPVEQQLEWTFPLAPGAEGMVDVRAEGLDFSTEEGWYSPSYGVRAPTTFLRARRRSRPGEDVTEIVVRVSV
ncbi:MAG TPA: alginate lyase family protein [Gaiellaceae bacterium]|nr:alginate lyase family protein [Gaiellaceae bacterium]